MHDVEIKKKNLRMEDLIHQHEIKAHCYDQLY